MVGQSADIKAKIMRILISYRRTERLRRSAAGNPGGDPADAGEGGAQTVREGQSRGIDVDVDSCRFDMLSLYIQLEMRVCEESDQPGPAAAEILQRRAS